MPKSSSPTAGQLTACLNASQGCVWKGPEEMLESHLEHCELHKCTDYECEWYGTLEELRLHMGPSCEFEFFACKNDECTWRGPHRSISGHLKECLFEMVTCEWCEQRLIRKDLEEHTAVACPDPPHILRMVAVPFTLL